MKVTLICLSDSDKTLEVSLEHASRILLLEEKLGNANYKLPKGFEFDGEKVKKKKTVKKDDSNDSTSERVN